MHSHTMTKSLSKNSQRQRKAAHLVLLSGILALFLLHTYSYHTNTDDIDIQNNHDHSIFKHKLGVSTTTASEIEIENLKALKDFKWFSTEEDLLNTRSASNGSPFFIVNNKRRAYDTMKRMRRVPGRVPGRVSGLDTEGEETRWLSRFDDDPLAQCQLLVGAMYEYDPEWDNADLMLASSSEDDREGAILLTERLRVYNYCFLQRGLDVVDVFDTEYFRSMGFDAWDFQCRMFPFLNREFDKERRVMFPRVVPVSKAAREFLESDDEGGLLRQPLESLEEEDTRQISYLRYNSNFMKTWIKASKGRGIVTTTEFEGLDMASSLLRVLQKLGNDLPVELVITNKNKMTSYFDDKLEQIGESTNQKFFLVDLSEIIDPTFSEGMITQFRHKWFAAIFNTFEEEILVDIDTVPFQPMETFFNEEGYKRTGIHMYRDRTISAPESKYRQEMLIEGSPSIEERVLIGTELVTEQASNSKESYGGFFAFVSLHRVDSGLIPIHKTQKLPGLLMGCFLHFIPRYSTVSHGDKEFFWLGQLFAGDDYSIDEIPGGVVGTIKEEESVRTVDGTGPGYSICGIQLAHCNREGKLLWSNGGMRVCKFDDAYEVDFMRNRKYFEKKWGNEHNLAGFYFSPIRIDGMIVPKVGDWLGEPECVEYSACAVFLKESIDNDGDDGRAPKSNDGRFIRFDPEGASFYDNISLIWNGLMLDILL